MAFSIRHFLRQISPTLLQAYFEFRSATVPDAWWRYAEPKLASALATHVLGSSDPAAEAIIAELNRLHPMATERGRTALLNASPDRPEITAAFGTLGNDHERAIWMLVNRPAAFKAGEELRFFDYYAEGSRGRAFRTTPNGTVSREPADIDAFTRDLCGFYKKRDGSGASCYAEILDRHEDGSIQITLYVQGLPSSAVEFVQGDFSRRVSHPAIEAAVVYKPETGETTTVARGGKEVHEALRDHFARRLLKIEPNFDAVRPRRFQLDSFKQKRALAPDPSCGVKAVRVRKLRLAAPNFGFGFLTIEAPPNEPDLSVYELGDRWFAEQASLFRKFSVVHATIAFHFHPVEGRSWSRTINVELTTPNTSNLKNFSDGDRRIAEDHIARWGLVDNDRR